MFQFCVKILSSFSNLLPVESHQEARALTINSDNHAPSKCGLFWECTWAVQCEMEYTKSLRGPNGNRVILPPPRTGMCWGPQYNWTPCCAINEWDMYWSVGQVCWVTYKHCCLRIVAIVRKNGWFPGKVRHSVRYTCFAAILGWEINDFIRKLLKNSMLVFFLGVGCHVVYGQPATSVSGAHACSAQQVQLVWCKAEMWHSWGGGGRFRDTYELLNLRAFKFSTLYKIIIVQCMG